MIIDMFSFTYIKSSTVPLHWSKYQKIYQYFFIFSKAVFFSVFSIWVVRGLFSTCSRYDKDVKFDTSIPNGPFLKFRYGPMLYFHWGGLEGPRKLNIARTPNKPLLDIPTRSYGMVNYLVIVNGTVGDFLSVEKDIMYDSPCQILTPSQ